MIKKVIKKMITKELTKELKNVLKNVLKGIGIGVANVIPGVSGGTVAVILNIYDKLTEAIGNFLLASKAKKIEYIKFLAQIGIGAVLGILLFARFISTMYTAYPRITTIIFILLTLPSIPIVLKGEKLNKVNLLFLIGGMLFALGFIVLTKQFVGEEVITNTTFTISYGLKLFLCGGIAASAMIIPGVSGSLLLLIMGEYYNILSYIKDFNIIPLIFFSAGMGLGMVLMSKMINVLLNKYRSYSLHFIVGIIVSSLIELLVNILV